MCGGEGYLRFRGLRVRTTHDLPWRRLEEQPEAGGRRRQEEMRGVWLNGILVPNTCFLL